MAYDIKSLMRNPAFLMGANMMAANQGRGMSVGPAIGKAAMGTMGQLSALEAASADRTYKNKMLDIQEARNTETYRSNKVKEGIMTSPAEEVYGDDGAFRGMTQGGRFYNKPSASMMDMMMMMNGGMPMMGGGGSPPPKSNPYDDVANALTAPQPAPAPAPAPAAAPVPIVPTGQPPEQAGMFPGMGAGDQRVLEALKRFLTMPTPYGQ